MPNLSGASILNHFCSVTVFCYVTCIVIASRLLAPPRTSTVSCLVSWKCSTCTTSFFSSGTHSLTCLPVKRTKLNLTRLDWNALLNACVCVPVCACRTAVVWLFILMIQRAPGSLWRVSHIQFLINFSTTCCSAASSWVSRREVKERSSKSCVVFK